MSCFRNISRESLRNIFAALCLLFLCWACIFRICGQHLTDDTWGHAIWAEAVIRSIRALFVSLPEIPVFEADTDGQEFYLWFVPGNPAAVFPVMICFFTGAPIIYFVVPFVFLLGPTTFAMVLPFLILTVVTCIIFWKTCQRVFDPVTADAALFLMCVNYFVIYTARQSADYETGLQIFLFWASVLAALKYKDRYSYFWLGLSGFLLGFALYVKLIAMVFIISGCILGFAGWFFPRFRRSVDFLFHSRRAVMVFFLFFFTGLMPFILYTVDSGFEPVTNTFEKIEGDELNPYRYDKLLDFETNLQRRYGSVKDIIAVWEGKHLLPRNFIWSLNVVFMLIVLLHSLLTNRRPDSFVMLMLFIFFALTFFSSLSSPNSYDTNHMGFLIAFFCIVKARLFVLSRAWGKPIFALVSVLLLIDVSQNLFALFEFLDALGGVYDFRDGLMPGVYDWFLQPPESIIQGH